MKLFKPPYFENISEYEGKTVFLGGSIEMGKAKDWQTEISDYFKNYKVTFFNPRRDDWDSSWVQSIENEEFRTQVLWEIDHILKADINLFFLEAGTNSPISLWEIGLCTLPHYNGEKKMIICCEQGFERRGNIEVDCYRFNIPLVDNLKDLKKKLKEMIRYGE